MRCVRSFAGRLPRVFPAFFPPAPKLDEAAQHPADLVAPAVKGLVLLSTDELAALGYVELGPQLGQRPARDDQKADGVAITSPIITLGYVRRHRDGSPLHLVDQDPAATQCPCLAEIADVNCEAERALPHLELTKIRRRIDVGHIAMLCLGLLAARLSRWAVLPRGFARDPASKERNGRPTGAPASCASFTLNPFIFHFCVQPAQAAARDGGVAVALRTCGLWGPLASPRVGLARAGRAARAPSG